MADSCDPIRFLTSDGLTLRGACWGNGDLRIVFSPGNGLPVETYAPAFTSLLDRVSIRIHGLNSRGQGGSDVTESYTGWESIVGEYIEFITQEMNPPLIVGGHSKGALLSLWVAAQAPHLVSGLLLLEPVMRVERNDPRSGTIMPDLREFIEKTKNRRAHWPSLADAEADLFGKGGYRDWQAEPFRRFLEKGLAESPEGGVRLTCPPMLEAKVYESNNEIELWKVVDRINVPVVVLRGETSDICHPVAMEQIAAAVPIGQVLTVKGGHTFPQEKPRPTGEALDFALRFLQEAAALGRLPL